MKWFCLLQNLNRLLWNLTLLNKLTLYYEMFLLLQNLVGCMVWNLRPLNELLGFYEILRLL